MTIRQACAEDAPGIAQVHVDTWRAAYRGIVDEEHLANLSYERGAANTRARLADPLPRAFCRVAEVDGQIIGFAAGGPERTGDPEYAGEVYAIYVLEAYQGSGVGRRLMQASARRLREQGMNSMLLWALCDNPACRFYERLGGVALRTQMIAIGPREHEEVAYGWTDLTPLLSP